MKTDYRALCRELFGTDDVDELRILAKKLNKTDTRNAGRKKKFSAEDVAVMEQLRSGGMTVNEIAKRYGTSRQIVGKYLNAKPQDGYTVRLTYMYRKQPCTMIDLDFLNQRVLIQNKTNDIMHRAFGKTEEPTWEDLEQFLRDRCVPETRGNLKEVLNDLQLDTFDPLQIVEKTHGRMADDDMWLSFRYYPRGECTDEQN